MGDLSSPTTWSHGSNCTPHIILTSRLQNLPMRPPDALTQVGRLVTTNTRMMSLLNAVASRNNCRESKSGHQPTSSQASSSRSIKLWQPDYREFAFLRFEVHFRNETCLTF